MQSHIPYWQPLQEQGNPWWDSLPISWRRKPSRRLEGSGSS
jgi:hypothetical protein